MTTQYKESKDVPTEVLVARLRELCRDADLVLEESANRMERLTAELEAMRGVVQRLADWSMSQVMDFAAYERHQAEFYDIEETAKNLCGHPVEVDHE